MKTPEKIFVPETTDLTLTRVQIAALFNPLSARRLQPLLAHCAEQMQARGLTSFGDLVHVNGANYTVDLMLDAKGSIHFSCTFLGTLDRETISISSNDRGTMAIPPFAGQQGTEFNFGILEPVIRDVLNVFFTSTTSDGRVSSVGLLPVGSLTQAMSAMGEGELARFEQKKAEVVSSTLGQVLAGHLVKIYNTLQDGDRCQVVAFGLGKTYEGHVWRSTGGLWFVYNIKDDATSRVVTFCPARLTPETPMKPDISKINLELANAIAQAIIADLHHKV